MMDSAQTIEHIWQCVRMETMMALGRCYPGERVTIFLSTRLFFKLEAVHMQHITHLLNPEDEMTRITLFGCNVEIYDDNKPSFYVTTAKKYEF